MSKLNLCILAVCALAALALGHACARRLPELTGPSRRCGRLELMVLAGVLVLGSLAIYGGFLVGRSTFAYRDLGLDTVDLYVPFYTNLIEGIRGGTLGAWNFEYGLGAAAPSYQSWLLDPFNLMLVPLGLLLGTERLPLVLVLVQIAKILVSGVTFALLLTRYCETPLGRVVGASCFAFGGFLILWGQHYWLGSVYVLFVVTVLQFERLMERSSAPRLCCAALVVAISVGWSAYCGFMSLLGCALYCLLRLIHRANGEHPVREVALGTLRLLVPVACGALLSGIALVPYASYLLGETSRVSAGDGSSLAGQAGAYLTSFVPLRWIPMILSRLLGNGLLSISSEIPAELVPPTESFQYVNCYEIIMLGFGALAIVLLAQFFHWALTECSARDRALVLAATALVLLYCLNEFLPALFNALVEPKYRSSFVLAVPVCIALALGWERRVQAGRVSMAALAAGAGLTLAVLAWSLVNTVDARMLCAAYLVMVLAFVVLLLAFGRAGAHAGPSPAVTMALAGLVVAGGVLDGFFVTQVRGTCDAGSFPRRESEATRDTMDALAWIRESDPNDLYRVEKTYTDWGAYNDALVEGYWGVSSYNSTTDGDVVEFYRTFWPDSLIGDSAYQDFRRDASGRTLLSQVGVRYVLSREPLEDSSYQLVHQAGDVLVYRNLGATPLLFSRDVVMGESALERLTSPAALQAAIGRALVVPDEVASRHEGETGASLSSALSLAGPDRLTGSLEASAPTVACLSVPFTTGWDVLVDGERVETFRANVGFLGFEVPAGTHDIEVRYSLPGLGAGAVASAAGVALTAGACLVSRALRLRGERRAEAPA